VTKSRFPNEQGANLQNHLQNAVETNQLQYLIGCDIPAKLPINMESLFTVYLVRTFPIDASYGKMSVPL
jgi:hypothetical protein